MAPFYSAPLIGRQSVSGGEKSWLSCLMSYVVCCVKLEGDCGSRGGSPAPFDRSVAEDTGESGLLIVSLRPGCIQGAVMHRSSRTERGFTGLKWQLPKRRADTMNIYNQSG